MRLLLAIVFCLGGVAAAIPATAPGPATANNALACELYGRLAAAPGNVFFSPTSVGAALSMALAGARGQTAQEMAAVLRSPVDGHAEAGEFQRQLLAGGLELHVANRLWVQRGLPLAAPFQEICRYDFAAEPGEVDFDGDRDGARQQINAWVSEQTRGKIPELLDAASLPRDVALVLTDAVHFLGRWMEPFAHEATAEAPFHLADGTEIAVATMRHAGDFAYAENARVQALRLAYEGGRQVCEIYLPCERDGLPALEAKLTAGWLEAWTDRWRPHDVAVSLPRFAFSARIELGPTLAAMGMPTAFSGDADFSGITTAARLAISNVVHEAAVAVDEAGTEAAAASAVVMTRTSGAPDPQGIVFTADHPFLFLIRDTETGAVLFLGRLADPRR
jgi:serpin B